MKAAAITVASLTFVLAGALAFPASSATGTHFTVHCAVDSDTTVVARAFDAAVVMQAGGKAHAIEIFKQQHPDGHCWVSGPHRDR
jgi:hypothetical protein